ncbi:hypothetical protein V8C86DRAFT_2832090 [Haematococcus lacustris]
MSLLPGAPQLGCLLLTFSLAATATSAVATAHHVATCWTAGQQLHAPGPTNNHLGPHPANTTFWAAATFRAADARHWVAHAARRLAACSQGAEWGMQLAGVDAQQMEAAVLALTLVLSAAKTWTTRQGRFDGSSSSSPSGPGHAQAARQGVLNWQAVLNRLQEASQLLLMATARCDHAWQSAARMRAGLLASLAVLVILVVLGGAPQLMACAVQAVQAAALLIPALLL